MKQENMTLPSGIILHVPYYLLYTERSTALTRLAGYAEDHSNGPMLRFQESLPRLPVPKLDETAERYLKSLHPLLSANEYATSEAAVQDFIKPGGVGLELQKRLLERRDDPTTKNWLYDWFNEATYFTRRDPVVLHTSVFASYRDDHSRRDPAKRAAAISSAILDFKKLVDTGSLEPDLMKNLPLCMESYGWVFNSTRVASSPVDFPMKFSSDDDNNKHFIVIRKNQFFKVSYEVDGKQINTSELEEQFNEVYRVAKRVPPVGALTSENRDIWADVRELLTQASSKNKEALNAIDSAAFIICLDDASPVTLQERARQYFHGDGANRWYDKPQQFIINDNGTAGFMGEHMMIDGTIPLRVNEYIHDAIFNNKIDSDPSIRPDLPKPKLIEFDVTKLIQAQIERAVIKFKDQVNQRQLSIQAYQGYGKGLIKRLGCSPDAYVQLVIQLAYFEMCGKCRPTYEAATTRRFQLGRTEACRTVSDESVAWCTSMMDVSQGNSIRIELFHKAVKAHVEYCKAAVDGRGVDRHLFGLKRLLQPDEEVPAIFKDAAFKYSSSWYLNTTQVSSDFFTAIGESQTIDDGFSVSYMIHENRLVSKRIRSQVDC